MKVSDVMTQEVVSISPDASVQEAAALMARHNIGGLPVVNAAHILVGILTDGDLLHRVEIGTEKRHPAWSGLIAAAAAGAQEYVDSRGRVVGELMSSPVDVAWEEMPLSEAAAQMDRRRFKRLPVVRGGRVVGIVSRADLMRALARTTAPAPAAETDEAIRRGLAEELSRPPFGARQGYFLVGEGVVDLWGTVSSEAERTAIRVAAENVPGVKKVQDHMILAGPAGGSASIGTGGRHIVDAY